ncbi:gamma-tubulin complex component 4, partial [Trifolium pratense]
CFLEESRQLMRLPPRQSTAEADLMVPFQLASLKTIGEEDKYFSKVSLRMPSYGITVKPSLLDVSKATSAAADGISGASLSNASSEMSVDGWDGIALEYSIDWPLHLFFTQEVLSKYLKVFQYLLRLKRTQMELEKLWASVDVIESQWNILQSHIQDSHDFTELVGFHQEYLSALISQTFLDIGSVSRILDGIMKLCLQFCWNIENQDNFSNTSELEHIAEEFNKKSNSLYTILRSSRLAGSQRTPFLRRFLLRLNLNSFFESTAKGVMNVVRPRPTLPGLNQQ